MVIYGNRAVLKDIRGAVNAPLHIFFGPKSVGKYYVAKELAKFYLCLEGGKENCGCRSCHLLSSNNHPDLLFISPKDGASSIKVDDITSVVGFTFTRPIISPYKVILIDDMETMTVEAQNKLLLTLEFPPEYVKTVVVTSKIRTSRSDTLGMLETIKSRGTIHKFNALSDEDMNLVIGNIESLMTEYDREIVFRLSLNCPGATYIVSVNQGLVKAAKSIISAVSDGNIDKLLIALGLMKEKDKNSIFEQLAQDDINRLIFFIKGLLAELLSRMYGQCLSGRLDFVLGKVDLCSFYTVYIMKCLRIINEVNVFNKDRKDLFIILLNNLVKIKNCNKGG